MMFKKCSNFHWCIFRGFNFILTVYELFDNPSYMYHIFNSSCARGASFFELIHTLGSLISTPMKFYWLLLPALILIDHFQSNTAVTWLKNCRNGVKLYQINQSVKKDLGFGCKNVKINGSLILLCSSTFNNYPI